MNKSESINEIAVALNKVQSELKGARKDSRNPFFNSSYADLSSVWEACRALLGKTGLSVIQTLDVSAEIGPVLVTTLAHVSGQWISGRYPINPVKQDPQGIGSAVTYARRYSLMAIIGIAAEDDDGNSASETVGGSSKRSEPLPVKQAVGGSSPPPPAKPLPPMDMSPFAAAGVALCRLCQSPLKQSKSGKGMFCTNYEDGRGEHTRFPINKLEEFLLQQSQQPPLPSEEDCPF